MFDLTVNAFEDLVTEVFSGTDEDQKIKLRDKLKYFTKVSSANCKRKVKINQENSVRAKKLRLRMARNVELPNESWIKIMNYLKTKDIFNNFALVCKLFHDFTQDLNSIRYFQVENIEMTTSKYESILKILGGCTQLFEFSISDDNRANSDFVFCCISKALESGQKLTSLRAKGFGMLFFNSIESFSLYGDFQRNIIKSKNLERIEINGLELGFDTWNRISKIKTLKNIKITGKDLKREQFIQDLADNENQLECFELNQYVINSDFPIFKQAIQNLLYKKEKTLKRIKLDYLSIGAPFGSQLDNLIVCQNLEEFDGTLFCHETKQLSMLPKLKKLILLTTDTGGFSNKSKTILHGISLQRLKYLSVQLFDDGLSDMEHNECCPILIKNDFPALERLYLSSKGAKATIEFKYFEDFLDRAPNLKSIQIDEDFNFDITNEDLFKMIKDRNIFVVFGQVLHNRTTKSKRNLFRQIALEDFLINDPIVYLRYGKMKQQFKVWCENNYGYGY